MKWRKKKKLMVQTPGGKKQKAGSLIFYFFLLGLVVAVGAIFSDELLRPIVIKTITGIKSIFGAG